jgi:hypothetical protein
VNDQAASTGASLSGSSHGSKYDCPDGHFDICIFRNDNGIIAAQLQNGFTQACSDRLTYFSYPLGSNRLQKSAESFIFGHPFANFSPAGNQVQIPFGTLFSFNTSR